MAKKRLQKENLMNFKIIPRETLKYRDVNERIKDYKDIYLDYAEEQIKVQASRCQNCGVPFCHGYGCPIANEIPDWNELVYMERWKEACELLHTTNNFPEITGRVCPALCEEACTLNIELGAVTIRDIERTIVERGFRAGWIKPEPPLKRSGKSIAVIGSGPAGLSAAQDLNRYGHNVTLFEKDPKAGGFLRYGIPDFKLEKWIVDRRLKIMEEEGVVIKTGVHIGKDITLEQLQKDFDVILLSTGSREPRDLNVEGRELKGIYLATDFLKQSNMRVDGVGFDEEQLIDAKDKNVVVIGGGDTGADCVGTSRRQGAKSVYQLEILPKPPEERAVDTPWPMYAKKLRTSSSHLEGCERKWCVSTKKIVGADKVEKIVAIEVEWKSDENGRWTMKEVDGTEFELKADIIFLAMGFVHPEHDKLINDLGIEFDQRGNFKTSNFGFGKTSKDKVYAAGDASRGASLVVHAIYNGKSVAEMIDEDLK